MPYSSGNEPANVQKLSPHKRKIWRSAFNAAYGQYGGDEKKAFATAWAAANRKTKDGKDLPDNVAVFYRNVDAPPTPGGITARAQTWESFREFIDAFSPDEERKGFKK
jgi:cation transport regulator ChaB